MMTSGLKTVEELASGPAELAGKRVFIRVDFNVPLDKKSGHITDDSRIAGAIPTIEFVIKAGGKPILASHLGRPKPGKTQGLSLEPCAVRLAELMNVEVLLPDDCIGESPRKVIHDLHGGQVCLLENLRFHEGEEANDVEFATELAELCDVYVNDAFGAVHRAHASVHALPRMMHARGAGMLLTKELDALGRLLSSPAKPYVALLGGAKVSDKLDVIEALLSRIDALCIGGAMANTFLAAMGKDMKQSRIEGDKLALARTILKKADTKGVKVHLPTDVVVAEKMEASSGEVVTVDGIPEGTAAFDIGPATLERFGQVVSQAKTIFWNGPMGLFESPPFAAGTLQLARLVASSGAFSVVGGGDSAAAVRFAGPEVVAGIGHISTGGGAALELIEGRKLPGIEALRSGGES